MSCNHKFSRGDIIWAQCTGFAPGINEESAMRALGMLTVPPHLERDAVATIARAFVTGKVRFVVSAVTPEGLRVAMGTLKPSGPKSLVTIPIGGLIEFAGRATKSEIGRLRKLENIYAARAKH